MAGIAFTEIRNVILLGDVDSDPEINVVAKKELAYHKRADDVIVVVSVYDTTFEAAVEKQLTRNGFEWDKLFLRPIDIPVEKATLEKTQRILAESKGFDTVRVFDNDVELMALLRMMGLHDWKLRLVEGSHISDY